MSSIYTYETGETLCEGLQGSNVCDQAIQTAKELAAEREEEVVLEDDDGNWLVDPDGSCTSLPENWA